MIVDTKAEELLAEASALLRKALWEGENFLERARDWQDTYGAAVIETVDKPTIKTAPAKKVAKAVEPAPAPASEPARPRFPEVTYVFNGTAIWVHAPGEEFRLLCCAPSLKARDVLLDRLTQGTGATQLGWGAWHDRKAREAS